jgi:hypothetical protein
MDKVPVELGTARSGWKLLLFVYLFFALSQVSAHEIRVDGDPNNNWIEGLANGHNEACCDSNDCYPLAVGELRRTSHG